MKNEKYTIIFRKFKWLKNNNIDYEINNLLVKKTDPMA